MNLLRAIRRIGCACCIALLLVRPLIAEVSESQSFRAILELAEIGPEALAQLGERPDYSDDDWRLLLEVFSRLQQFREIGPSQPTTSTVPEVWLAKDRQSIGELFEVAGQVVSVEAKPLPKQVGQLQDLNSIYRCTFQFVTSDNEVASSATILSTRIPKGWQTKQTFQEPVRVRGVLVQLPLSEGAASPLLLANHIAWYPAEGAPTGQLLLARHGMDVALLDEVRHRQPFVKPEISREGEAFYAALIALSQVDQQELVRLATENVARVADAWRTRLPELRRTHQTLKEQLANEADTNKRNLLQREVKAARDRRGLAAAVLELNESNRSSVAPLFLQPHEEVGELVSFEGVARRAVRIPAADQPALDAYYEIEIFTSDSQNLPIVCCMNELPAGFPSGDEIREPVRITGVFFKNWRYRSRKLVGDPGETSRQRRLYTPVLLGKTPTWLNQASSRGGPWALWGGIAFMGLLLTLWISLSWLARRDRTARAALRRDEIIDL